MHPSQRFSRLVDNYKSNRPSYPPEVMAFLRSELGIRPDHVLADIGSGTGISTRMLLDNGNRVFGVEPNASMAAAAQEALARYGDRFIPVQGTAERTTLASQSVDFIVAAQAFHWFDGPTARRELLRILRPGGAVVLIWNARRTGGSPFLAAYEALLLRYGTDYLQVSHQWAHKGSMEAFFAPHGYRPASFPNHQDVDLDGMLGRLFSSSYVPGPGHPDHEPLLDAARSMFAEHNVHGIVRIEYDTNLYFGSLDEDLSGRGPT